MVTEVRSLAYGQLEAIGGRYRLEGVLGEGGMAVVYQALDLPTGKRIALKQMRAPGSESRRIQMTAQFEREFLTLAQLAHPRIVEVYDYGVDARGPYYTMELLDGGDLQQLAPVDWRGACALARDVCSALSLLHSRRLVYRDLSPRNIRCTGEGSAKLIDFGGMAAMGPNPNVIGTPPCAAPEVLDCRPLDARTDLYALGATLYYALVRRQAYPARTFAQLSDVWRTRPARPSTIVSDLPEALDRLVMELLRLDPAARPVSAGEVMDRLSAILGTPPEEHLRVHQAYLSTPTLVGRGSQLEILRERTLLSPKQRGTSVLIHGAEGTGRSRVLDACALEAKLSGMIVLRADAKGGEGVAYGAARSLIAQLLESAHELAIAKLEPYLVPLAAVLPELGEGRAPAGGEQKPGELPQDQAPFALLCWLRDVAEERPLLVAIDDIARIDQPSAAFIGLLAEEASTHSYGVVVTATSTEVRTKERHPVLALMSRESTLTELSPLNAMQTKELLGSVFGDVPNLHVLASYVDQVAAGNPRDVMRLAQHLVSEKLIRYAFGTWSLPERLPTAGLPSSMAEALKARLDKLSAGARCVAYAFSCESRHRFTLDECLELTAAAEPSEMQQTLRELLDAAVIVRVGPCYRLAQLGFFELFATTLTLPEVAQVHLRLANVYQRRDDGVRAAQHLFRGGEEERGVQALLAHCVRSAPLTTGNSQAFFDVLKTLPRDWLSVYDHALNLCEKQGRAHKDRDLLLSRLNAFVAHTMSDTGGFAYLKMRLSQLERDAGLDLYAALPASLGPELRLRRALEQASERYQQTLPHQRVLAPLAAIKPLASTLLAALSTIGFTNDYTAFRQLPSLAPLVPLSPAMLVVDQMAQGLGARITARSERALAIYGALLVRMSQPDRAGLQVSEHLLSRLRVTLSMGAIEASMGLRRALNRADLVQDEPEYETQGLMLRNLCQLWQGQSEEAARTKRRLEIRKTLSTGHHGFDGQYLLSELCAYALADDLTHVKQATDAAATYAAVHPAWVPVLHYGRGEYHRIRGGGERALAELHQALSLMQDSHHQAFPNAAGALLRTLVELRRHDEAIRLGEAYLKLARVRGLGYVRSYLKLPLSLALSGVQRHAQAVALSDSVIADLRALGSSGLNLALAYETRARVALLAEDGAGFEHYAALGAEQWPAGRKRLMATCQSKAAYKAKDQDPQQVDLAASELREVPEKHPRSSSSCQLLARAKPRGEWLAGDDLSQTRVLHVTSSLSVSSSQDR